MLNRITTHQEKILYGKRKKYLVLNKAYKEVGVSFDVIYYGKNDVGTDALDNELSEREAYYINYYLPPLNRTILRHKDFKRQKTKINDVEDYKDAMALAKNLEYRGTWHDDFGYIREYID